MACLKIGRLRTHEMRKFECDGFIVPGSLGGFELKS